MFRDFNLKHIPALYFGLANCVGLVVIPLSGTSRIIQMYGLPPRIADVPEAWPVWQAGQGRLIMLGVLMLVFYARRQYAACDTMVMASALLGINDFLVVWFHGNRNWAWFRLVGTFLYASTGYLGWAQSGTKSLKAR
ncbi:hypothetical protein E8E14_004089 [Neopestalotiopsis sp. 37M]|nr:hypothetical protein E8E14_004089 [Neopestalotiopsis sp. 37M]